MYVTPSGITRSDVLHERNAYFFIFSTPSGIIISFPKLQITAFSALSIKHCPLVSKYRFSGETVIISKSLSIKAFSPIDFTDLGIYSSLIGHQSKAIGSICVTDSGIEYLFLVYP